MTTELARHAAGARRGPPRRWRSVVFAPVGDGSTRRRASDAVRVVVAVAVVAVALLLIDKNLSVEQDVVDAVTPPPWGLSWLFTALLFVGSIAATIVVIGLALLARRLRLARDLAVVAAATWLMCGVLGWVLGPVGGRPTSDLFGSSDVGFPLARLAVTAAVISLVASSLSRGFRRALFVLLALAAVAAVFVGTGLPLDMVATLALGWGMAAVVRLVFGSPVGLPSEADVVDAAGELRLDLVDVEPVHPQVWGVAQFTATTAHEPVHVSIYGRDAADAQFLAKLWRFLWYRDSGPTLSLTRLQEVEHEAYLTLAAERIGAHVPDVLVAASTSTHEALLVTRPPDGTPLRALEANRVTDDVLVAACDEVGRLRQAGIAHGSLSLDSIVVASDGSVGLRDFRAASASATDERLDRDLGALLIVLAMQSDPERATAAMARSLGTPALIAALPQIQMAAVDRPTRAELRRRKKFLASLRDAGAEAAGVESPKLAEIHRVSWSGVAMAAGALLGIYLLAEELSGVGGIWATLQTAILGWVFLCFVAAQLTNVAQAWSVMGSVSSPLPFGPTLALELANAFTGLVGGTVGTTATIIRYFQKRGLAVSIAVSSGVLVSVANMIVQAVMFVVAAWLSWGDFNFSASTSSTSDGGSSHDGSLILVAIVVAAALVGVLTMVPRFRRKAIDKLQPQVTAARDNLKQLSAQPGKLVHLFGGAVGSQILFAIALGFALKAYGMSLPIGELIVINTIASLLGGIAPVPGGMGVIEAGLIAGLTAAGIPESVAVAATITQRMFTCYLPPIWGYPTLAWMRNHDYL